MHRPERAGRRDNFCAQRQQIFFAELPKPRSFTSGFIFAELNALQTLCNLALVSDELKNFSVEDLFGPSRQSLTPDTKTLCVTCLKGSLQSVVHSGFASEALRFSAEARQEDCIRVFTKEYALSLTVRLWFDNVGLISCLWVPLGLQELLLERFEFYRQQVGLWEEIVLVGILLLHLHETPRHLGLVRDHTDARELRNPLVRF